MSTNENALTDRSRILSFQTCPRKRWYEYEYRGRGISPKTYPVPLITGIAVHEGLGWLLKPHAPGTTHVAWCEKCASAIEWYIPDAWSEAGVGFICGECRLPVRAFEGKDTKVVTEVAVRAALKAFDDGVSKRQLALDSDEDPGYAYLEQRALVEALVRVYALVQLPRDLEEYEVLEVERDETWQGWAPGVDFMFKADGLFKHRDTSDLHILSTKTAGRYGKLNEDSAMYDVQGLSELAGVENRLRQQYVSPAMFAAETFGGDVEAGIRALAPRVEAIRMLYLVKGDRHKDDYDGGVKKQNSFLVRPWMDVTRPGENRYSWRFQYEDEMGNKKRLGKGWKRVNIWEHMEMKQWVEMLHNQEVFPNPDCYFESPLEEMVKTPVPYMRQEQDVLDWLEQARAQEVQVAENSADINNQLRCRGNDFYEQSLVESNLGRMLNESFPMYRQSCTSQFGAPCIFVPVCHHGVSPDPEDGEYVWREPHHSMEVEKFERLYQITR